MKKSDASNPTIITKDRKGMKHKSVDFFLLDLHILKIKTGPRGRIEGKDKVGKDREGKKRTERIEYFRIEQASID